VDGQNYSPFGWFVFIPFSFIMVFKLELSWGCIFTNGEEKAGWLDTIWAKDLSKINKFELL
jgi:hypothetical protein